MFENLFPFLRDVVVIGYMLVLRIAVPVIIVLFMGWWLQRKLAERDAREMEQLKRKQAQLQEKSVSDAPQRR